MTSPVLRRERGSNAPYLSGATELGISQQSISKIEQTERLEDETLERITKILGVTSEAIKNFSEEAIFNYFNTFNDNSTNNGIGNNHHYTFNPLDKLIEVVEKNEKLYEQLLKSEREKNELLRKGKQ